MTACTALIACMAAADAAWACNEPKISVSPGVAGPGDTVRYTISDTEAGADWTVTVAGRSVASGTSDGSAPTGTFTMPDLGSKPLNPNGMLEVTHAGDSQSSHPDETVRPVSSPAPLRYRPPTAAPEPLQDPTVPGPPEPATGFTPAEPQKKQEPRGNRPDSGPSTDPPRGLDPAPASPRPASPEPAVESRLGARSAVPLRDEPRADDRNAVAASRPGVETRAPLALPGPQPARRIPVVRATGRALPRAAPASDRGERLPAVVLIAAGVLGLGAAAAAAWWALRGPGPAVGQEGAGSGPRPTPPGPDPQTRDLLVEAELQELIAEERAREVSRDDEPVSSDSV